MLTVYIFLYKKQNTAFLVTRDDMCFIDAVYHAHNFRITVDHLKLELFYRTCKTLFHESF